MKSRAKKSNWPQHLFQILLLIFSGHFAQAYLFTGESAEPVKPSVFRLTAYPQLKISDGSGFNLAAAFRNGWSDSISYGAHLGMGDTDFFGSAHVKWTPFPDYDSQPAIGFKMEGILGREASDTILGGRIHPIVSKKFDLELGLLTPYAALPIGLQNFAGNTDFQFQVVGGSEYHHSNLESWNFGAEVGVNLAKTFSFILAYASYDLDSTPPKNRKTRR